MKTILIALLVSLTGLELLAQVPPPPASAAPGANPTPGALRTRQPRYLSNLPTPAASAKPSQPEEPDSQAVIEYNFAGIDVNQVLDQYAKLVNRTVLRANLPEAKIVLKTQTPLTKAEAIQALQAVMALNNISVVNIGEKFVKAAQSDQANSLGAEFNRSTNSANLPNLGTYITHITQLKYVKPSLMMPLITPFSKLPNSVTPIDDNGILVIRDYAENVKRMLEMIEQIDVSVPAEFISEVIPIRYAKVDEIASALNSLGGGGGGTTVSIGQGVSSAPISGLANRNTGMGSMGGMNNGMGGNTMGGSSFGNRATTTPNGTPSTGSSFQQRLQNIVNRAGSSGGGAGGNQQDIQLFGQTKIIPNESSSTLLIYATRQDMAMIKEIIGKLDVPLAQVLIEAVIMDVTIGHSFNMGVTASQKPKTFYNPNNSSNILETIAGAGGMNNGASLLNFLTQSVGTNGASSFGNSLPGGFSYFGNIGPTFDLAVQAAQGDSRASIIQRPRIQTSQAKQAQFFVGETKPYVTSTYNGYNGGYGGSSYSQLSAGVELGVTPFINPDGEVTMEILQNIDDFNGTTTIAGVGDVPNTIKRTLNTTITVRDRDTVMLGGFIKSDKSTSKSGVPFLQDIPLLGNLFTQRSDNKDRSELIVLVRPTVLKTPELAARQTVKEAQRLPGISGAAAEDAAYEHKLIEAQRKRELRAALDGSNTNGFFNVLMPVETIATNTVPPGAMEDHVLPPPPILPDPMPASSLVDPAGTALEAARTAAVVPPAVAPNPGASSSNVKDLSPAQKKKLAALINDRMAGKVTDEEYKKQRDAVLNAEN